MYIYLLHSFVLYPIREIGLLGGEHSSIWWLAGHDRLLHRDLDRAGEPVVRRMFRPLIEPKPHWLFLRRRPGQRDPIPHGASVDPTGSPHPPPDPAPRSGSRLDTAMSRRAALTRAVPPHCQCSRMPGGVAS